MKNGRKAKKKVGHAEENPNPNEPQMGKKRKRAKNWSKGDITNLMLACNAKKKRIKGSFDAHSNGERLKRKAWREMAAYVSNGSNVERTTKECEDKLLKFGIKCKEKNRRLNQLRRQSGGGPVQYHESLEFHEEMMCDYLSRAACIGVPGIQATSLYNRRRDPAEGHQNLGPWFPDRPTKPHYDRIKLK